jgi:hypothetical protein
MGHTEGQGDSQADSAMIAPLNKSDTLLAHSGQARRKRKKNKTNNGESDSSWGRARVNPRPAP